MIALAAPALLALALQAPPAEPPPPSASMARPLRRGPIDSRDEHLLSQPRLTLPAVSPDPLAPGETRVRLAGDWGNDFGLRRRLMDGQPVPLFLVDGEHRSLTLQLRHGLSERLSLEARLPVLWRGGGVLDAVIDAWHDLLGLPDSNRPEFPRGRLRVEGLDSRSQPLAWTGASGAGLGNLELAASWALRRAAPGGEGWAAAMVMRVDLPLATEPFAGAGLHAGAQLVTAHSLWSAADVYLGAGGTLFARRELDGILYPRARPQGFLAFEWRPGRPLSLLAEVSAAGRMVQDLERFPGFQLYLKLGAKLDVGRRWRLEGGFTEGLRRITNTTDFGVMIGLERRFSGPD